MVCLSDREEPIKTYNLYGVIVHEGQTLNSGHYVSYVKTGESWHRCSDEYIRSVKWSDVRQKEAYILFYQISDIWYISIINHFTILKLINFLWCSAAKLPSSWYFQECCRFHSLISEHFFMKQRFCSSSKQNSIYKAKLFGCSCPQAHFARHLGLSCRFWNKTKFTNFFSEVLWFSTPFHGNTPAISNLKAFLAKAFQTFYQIVVSWFFVSDHCIFD